MNNTPILILNGSSRVKGISSLICDFIQLKFNNNLFVVNTVNLAETNIPFFSPNREKKNVDVMKFLRLWRRAKLIFVMSPEYHGSLSGILKNALDWLRPEDAAEKQIVLIGIAGGKMGASGAISAMRNIFHNLHSRIFNYYLSVSESHLFMENNQINWNHADARRLETLIQKVKSDLMSTKSDKIQASDVLDYMS